MALEESLFAVPEMDCPSEERLIRMVLDGAPGVTSVACDLRARQVTVVHDGHVDEVAARLDGLGLGARRLGSRPAPAANLPPTAAPLAPTADGGAAVPGLVAPSAGGGDAVRMPVAPTARGGDAVPAMARRAADRRDAERSTLKLVLAINAVMFAVELVLAWVASSAGLLADSLDMFADAAVYGLALRATTGGDDVRRRAARVAGWLQAALAVAALAEVARRFLAGSDPEPPLMMIVAAVALAANVTCLWLVGRHRDGGAHMQASVIFSTTDVLANLGVILAGALVAWTGSRHPDLVIGAIIAALVLVAARRILRLGRRPAAPQGPAAAPKRPA